MNKSLKIYVLIALVMFLLMLSCNKRMDQIKTSVYSYEENFHLTNEISPGVLSINMNVELPVDYQNKRVMKNIRNDIVKNIFGEQYVGIENDSLLISYAIDLERDFKTNNLPFVESFNDENRLNILDSEHIIETSTQLNDNHIYSYGRNIYVYTGGAHGLFTTVFYNYNMSDGSRITQKDIFTKEGLKELPTLFRAKIIENSDDIDTLEEFSNIYWSDELKPNDNFYISYEGITYIFNPYEIAPYAMGITEIFIPFSEIKNWMKEEAPISYLLKN